MRLPVPPDDAMSPNEDRLGRDLERGLAPLLTLMQLAGRCHRRGLDYVQRYADGTIVVHQAKNYRRRFTLQHEREAFNIQFARRFADPRRTATFLHECGHLQLERAAHPYTTEDIDLFPVLHLDWPLVSTLQNHVVVSRDQDTSARGDDAPTTLVVEVLSADNAFLRNTWQSAALIRLGMILCALFASLAGRVHAAARTLAPPGRLVTAYSHPTRGPDCPHMTTNPVMCGMSSAYAYVGETDYRPSR